MNGKLAPALLLLILGTFSATISYLYVTKADASDLIIVTDAQIEQNDEIEGIKDALKIIAVQRCHELENVVDRLRCVESVIGIYGPHGPRAKNGNGEEVLPN